jgi:subtilisin family serine protease
VYGGRPNGGGASAIVAALNWLVGSRVSVINISLVGPSNRALAAAVEAAIARGCVVVAAVGNDGPAAAPLYPASYDGVIGVTGVDQRNRVLPEAGRGAQVDFAAPGMDFSAATPEGAYSRVRGTSYAAPIVAGLAASHISAPNSEAAERAQQSLRATAVDLGARGVDRVYGAGLIGANMRGSQHLARR